MIKTAIKITTIGTALAILAIMVGSRWGEAAQQYEYQRRDEAAEQKKVTAKLREDNKKADLAIRNTKILIDKSQDRPYLPELYLRLAELYIEKSRFVFFLHMGQKAQGASSLNQLESNMLKNKAIEVYQLILDHFPDYGERDKVHFFMAHEYRELNQNDAMIVQYRTIIKEHPDSAYVPEAYLLLGDYFMAQQDLEMAKRQYEAVLNYAGCSALAIARYKLAWCYINIADYNSAIKLFEASVSSAATEVNLDIDTYQRVDIKLESLIDMAYCYPEVYKSATPQEALAYFQNYAWSRQSYTTVLEKLANRYFVKKLWAPAAAIYRQLADLRNDPEKLLEYTGRIFECSRTMGTYEAADQDVALIVKALKGQKYSIHIAKAVKEKNLKDYERYARHLVTHLHDKARQAKSIEDFARAADAYGLYLEFFTDSPAYKEMAANYAETLFSSNRYLEAAKRYEALAADKSATPADRREKLYSAVIGYYNALKHKDKLNYYEAAYARNGLATSGKRYAAENPSSPYTPDVLFNVAWVAYDSGRHQEAISQLSDYVARYPNAKATSAAVHLILDAYHLEEKYDGLIAYGKKVLADPRIKDPQLKQEVAKIVQGAETKVVSSLTLAAVNDWDKGKKGLMEAAQKNTSDSMGEQALNALIASSKEKGDLETLFSAGSRLIERYPHSSKFEDTLGLMIDSAFKMGQFRLVADYLEAFSAKRSQHPDAVEFIDQAGHIRQNLGQYKQANLDYQQLLLRSPKNWGKRPEIVFDMAENAERSDDLAAAIRILDDNYDALPPDAKVRADALRAALCYRNGQDRLAQAFKQKASSKFSAAKGKDDPILAASLAEAAYDEAQRADQQYLALQLKSRIDNDVVKQKAKLLGEVEKKYQEVIAYQSPAWALKACFRAAVANDEFARFLKEAPLPDLTESEKAQYTQLIQQKAKAYADKAEQYRQTCTTMAHKWELCDPSLAAYYRFEASSDGKQDHLESFSASGPSADIGAQSLKDEKLNALHAALLKEPQNPDILRNLAQAYIQKGDFRQAAVIAQNALAVSANQSPRLKAGLYNLLGVSHLYCRDDARAKEDFKQALSLDADHLAAKVNLAGLYRYYGHEQKAQQIYATLPGSAAVEQTREMIHPRAGELFYVQTRVSQR